MLQSPTMRTAALILLALLFQALPVSSSAAAHEGLLPAPYQIEGLVSFKNDQYRMDTGLGLNPPLVAVDLGDAENAPHPGSDNFQIMTIVGTTGVATGKLAGIRKICDYLCGDEGTTCHYVAYYSLDGSPREANPGEILARIGTPLMAIPGEQALAGFRAVTPEAGAAFPPALIGRDFAPLAYTPHGKDGPETRITGWDAGARKVAWEGRWSWGDTFTAEGRDCTLSQIGGLTAAQCNGIALLLGEAAPLLYSFPDYNSSSAEVVAVLEFELGLGKSTLYAVRLGLKAQTVFGLLYRDKDGWRGLFRPRNYALLC